jgi:hypothetical protein
VSSANRACCVVTIHCPTPRWSCWLRHYAASRKVAGSIPGEVVGIFSCPKISSRIMLLPSTQPLTEISNKSSPGGGGNGRSLRLTVLPTSVSRLCRNSGNLDVSQLFGPHTAACYWNSFTYYMSNSMGWSRKPRIRP